MNLLIGLVILLCLVCSELHAVEAVNDLSLRLLMVAVVSLTVPGLALFQMLLVSQRLRDQDVPEVQKQSIIRRLSVCHSAVWLSASLAIIYAVRWQDIVRGNWTLDRWPLLDELFILAPVVLSLVASWAIFYEIQHTSESGRERQRVFDFNNLRKRIGFVSIRIRVYFLMVLIPISLAVLARDIAPWTNNLSPVASTIFYSISGLIVIAGFPFLLLLIWKNERVGDVSLRQELVGLCKHHRLYVYDVRIWKTGHRIVNALVAGIIPGFRVILLSDSLVKLFPKNELLAVVRHESGHLRLWHLPLRISFIVLPLIALTIDEANPVGFLSGIESLTAQLNLPSGSGLVLVAVTYTLYLLVNLTWLSHQMEFEADIFACQFDSNPDGSATTDSQCAGDMCDALLRLASITPNQFDRQTLMHPSIEARILLIKEIQDSPEKAERFRTSFARRRRIVLAILVAICVFALSI